VSRETTLGPGRAWVLDDDIDTDQIIPSRFLVSSDPAELGEHAFSDLRPEVADSVAEGDFVVAGENFGSGSSREHAPLSLLGAGIDGVIAESFARIFYRNGINLGLPVLVCPEAGRVRESDEISVDFVEDAVVNHTRGESYGADSLPPFLQELVDAGGLETYTKRKLENEPP
jgi:3-isopropylmalate/(R)-2-methylmalate dehydratase small subunit